MFLFRMIGWLVNKILVFLIAGIFGVGTLLLCIYHVDKLTDSQYGEGNIYIIVGTFSFFPTFIGLFVIFLWNKIVKERKKTKKRNRVYLKEEIFKKGLH